MSDKNELQVMLTPGKAAEYLNVTRQTIYNLISKKKIPAYKIGAHWRLKKSEIDEWLKKHKNL